MISNIQPLSMTLGPMLNFFGKALRNSLKQENLFYSLEHIFVLKMVLDCDSVVVQQDLAEKLGKDKSFILRLVDSLEKDGLIRRIVDPNDRRRNILEVTYLGNQLLHKFYEIELKVSEALWKDLSHEEMDVFNNVLTKLKHNAEKL